MGLRNLDEQLQRWLAAGLIDQSAAEAISAHESARVSTLTTGSGSAVAVTAAGSARQRVSLQEVIAYAGVALALGGAALVIGLHREDLRLEGRLVVYLVVITSAVAASVMLMRGGDAGRRAALGCQMVAIIGAGIAVGDVAGAGGWFTVHHLRPAVGPDIPASDDVDHSGDVVLAFSVVAALSLVATWRQRSGLLALMLATGIFGATLVALAARDAGSTVFALVSCVPAAALMGFSLAPRNRDGNAGEVLRFLATLTPATLLLIVDGSPAALLTAAAGGLSLAALLVSRILNSNALAVAGGLSLFGFVVTVGVRWFSGPLGLPLVLIGAGLTLIGVATLLQRIVTGNRNRVARDAGLSTGESSLG